MNSSIKNIEGIKQEDRIVTVVDDEGKDENHPLLSEEKRKITLRKG